MPDEHRKPFGVTEESVDPAYNSPVVETSELRESPVPHRYVNGRFDGTGARFSFYFPPAELYRGRFFHNTYPLALTEDIAPFPIAFDIATGDLGFTFDSGAYYVQTNLGGADRMPPADPAIAAYRVNAAAAKFSRVIAAELFGGQFGRHRPFGYLYGGSGGAYQVIGAALNTEGVWDGFLPYVMAVPNAIPSMFTVRMHALRVLRRRGKLPGVADALDAGGSGDPYAGLDAGERAALREAFLLGFPQRGWWDHEHLDSGYSYNVADLVPTIDPSYAEEFWTKPGYLGADPAAPVQDARARAETSVARVIPGFPMRLELNSVPDWDITNARLVMTSGASAGASIAVAAADGRTVTFALSAPLDVLGAIQPDDTATLDNSWPLALETYHRHQVSDPSLYGWDQFRGEDGQPAYPQRPVLTGPIAARSTAGSDITGHLTAKTLLLECLMDIDAFAWQADWFRSTVRQALGPGFTDKFAVWFIDRATHDVPQTTAARAHTVSYRGVLQQGLRDLSAWAERGIRPAETAYEVSDTQVIVPASAVGRGGIQPVVDVHANGTARAEVAVGEPVAFTAVSEVPPNAGTIVAAEWDFEGTGTYPAPAVITAPRARVELSARYAYGAPGTYFAVLRVTAQREGDLATPYGRVQNLGRVRVVVTLRAGASALA